MDTNLSSKLITKSLNDIIVFPNVFIKNIQIKLSNSTLDKSDFLNIYMGTKL